MNKNNISIEELKDLFLEEIGGKSELSILEKSIVKYYGLEEDLDIINSFDPYTEEDKNRIKRRAAFLRFQKKFDIKNVLLSSINNIISNVADKLSEAMPKQLGEVSGYSEDLPNKEKIILSTENISFILGKDVNKNIILDIEYEGDISYITISNIDSLDDDNAEYSLICILEYLGGPREIINFTKNNPPNKIEIDEGLTNMLRNKEKVFFLINK